MSELDYLSDEYSDAFKDVYGVRPRYVHEDPEALREALDRLERLR